MDPVRGFFLVFVTFISLKAFAVDVLGHDESCTFEAYLFELKDSNQRGPQNDTSLYTGKLHILKAEPLESFSSFGNCKHWEAVDTEKVELQIPIEFISKLTGRTKVIVDFVRRRKPQPSVEMIDKWLVEDLVGDSKPKS